MYRHILSGAIINMRILQFEKLLEKKGWNVATDYKILMLFFYKKFLYSIYSERTVTYHLPTSNNYNTLIRIGLVVTKIISRSNYDKNPIRTFFTLRSGRISSSSFCLSHYCIWICRLYFFNNFLYEKR